MGKFSHYINLKIGLDLSEILDPKYIPGIKKYLHVDSDAELFETVLQDKFRKISQAIQATEDGSLHIVQAGVEQAQAEAETQPEVPETVDSPDSNTETANIYNGMKQSPADDTLRNRIINGIQRTLEDFEDTDQEISSISISETMAGPLNGTADIYKETKLDMSIEINFEELDDEVLMIISYIDRDQNIKYRIFDKKQLETEEENQDGQE